MSGHDYTGTYTTGITLTNPNYNPVTVSAGAIITNPSGAALDSTLAFDWTIGNFGLIQSTGTAAGATGIALSAGGVVSNAGAGRITGYDVGVSIAGTGTVFNQGAIDATQANGRGYSYNTATGIITPLIGGVIMGGGAVTNATSATIINYFEGVAIGSSGTVVNAGSIEATSTAHGFGVLLTSSGFVSNAATGTISGLFGILALGTSAATAINQGVITGSSQEAVDLFAGGFLSNAATGTITSGSDAFLAVGSVVSTIVNAGLIAGGSTSTGADLASGGLLANTGTITGGRYGITTGGTAPSTVTNAGSIAGTMIAGIFLEQAGSLDNASTGTITGGYDAVFTGGSIASTVTNAGVLHGVDVGGAYLAQGGVLINAATGTITASIYGVRVTNAAGSVINAGSVSSTSDFVTRVGTATVNVYQPAGVGLVEGGSVTNALSGAIAGAFGIAITGAVGTVINDGSINSPHVRAVYTIGSDGMVTNFTPAGVYMNAGGSVTNDAPGTITGDYFGVRMLAAGSVVNAGSVSSSSDFVTRLGPATVHVYLAAGVDLVEGGSVTNALSGAITGAFGVAITGAVGTVINDGGINSPHVRAVYTIGSDGTVTNFIPAGVYMNAGGSITNDAPGTITGDYFGVRMLTTTGSVPECRQHLRFAPDGRRRRRSGGRRQRDQHDLRQHQLQVDRRPDRRPRRHRRRNRVQSGQHFRQRRPEWRRGLDPRPRLRQQRHIRHHRRRTVRYRSLQQRDGHQPRHNRRHIRHPGYAIAIDEDVPGYSVRLIDLPGAVFTGQVQGGNPASTVHRHARTDQRLNRWHHHRLQQQIHRLRRCHDRHWRLLVARRHARSVADTCLRRCQRIPRSGQSARNRRHHHRLHHQRHDRAHRYHRCHGCHPVAPPPAHHLREQRPGLCLAIRPRAELHPNLQLRNIRYRNNLTLACFVAGTRIHTEQGPIPVEALRTGICVPAHFSGISRVVWVGHRHIDCRRHPNPRDVWPIRIRANAFASRRPTVDLYLSPDHAIYLNGVLIPIRHLINGTTVRQVPVDAVAYYHVELPRHDVLIAEGLAVESYLDIGDRANFANAGNTVRLHADFAGLRDPRALWDANACAPLVVHGPQLDAARRRLNRRAPVAEDLGASRIKCCIRTTCHRRPREREGPEITK